MRRREVIALVAGAVASSATPQAQQGLPVIAVLNAGSARSTHPYVKALIEGMATLGYVDGRNIRIEYRFADGDLARLPNLAAELVSLQPAVIIAAPLMPNLAVARLTTIPIIMASSADPVGFGLVKSLAHPGGNVTGMSIFSDELAGKQLEIARELIPTLRKAGILINVTNRLHEPQFREVIATATRLGAELVKAEVRSDSELEATFAALGRDGVEAVLVPPDTSFLAARQLIAELAAKTRVPAFYGFREHVDAGGLVSYGVNLAANYGRAASYVDKILKGAKPADLHVEQATKFELVINFKTAKELGLKIPPMLLARADEVIE